jgi:translation initiation factor IF-1
MNNNNNFLSARGEVIKSLRNNTFRIKCDNGQIVIATIASRFRTSTGRRKAKIVIGDKVNLEMPLGDLEKGQIVGF